MRNVPFYLSTLLLNGTSKWESDKMRISPGLMRFLATTYEKTKLLLKARLMRESLSKKMTEVHFFTIVLNGMPFIKYHIRTFEKLSIPWKWHIVEGVAELKHDSAWPLKFGGTISNALHDNGLSNDGTSQYIDELVRTYPENIFVYRKSNGQFWNGKVEMCNAIRRNIHEPCLLWQIDVDEFWTKDQIEKVSRIFQEQPERTAAYFFCHYFVGPELVVTSVDTYGNQLYEWLRVWRYQPDMYWTKHEPPTLCTRSILGETDVATINPISRREMEDRNVVFDHYAYVLPKQLHFKQIYYGYRDAIKNWRLLQEQSSFPVKLKDFFPWVSDESTVALARENGIHSLIPLDEIYAECKLA